MPPFFLGWGLFLGVAPQGLGLIGCSLVPRDEVRTVSVLDCILIEHAREETRLVDFSVPVLVCSPMIATDTMRSNESESKFNAHSMPPMIGVCCWGLPPSGWVYSSFPSSLSQQSPHQPVINISRMAGDTLGMICWMGYALYSPVSNNSPICLLHLNECSAPHSEHLTRTHLFSLS